jgi:hypothetical protein
LERCEIYRASPIRILLPETSGNSEPHHAFGPAIIVRNIACLGLYNIIQIDPQPFGSKTFLISIKSR